MGRLRIQKNVESYFSKESIKADGGKEAIAQLRNVVFEIGKSLSGILKARNRAGIFNFIEFKLI